MTDISRLGNIVWRTTGTLGFELSDHFVASFRRGKLPATSGVVLKDLRSQGESMSIEDKVGPHTLNVRNFYCIKFELFRKLYAFPHGQRGGLKGALNFNILTREKFWL